MPEWLNISIFWLTQLFMLVGLFGLVVPIFPGTVIIWLAALGYGLVTGFGTLGTVLFVIITLLMLAGTIVDNLFMGAGARKGGASWLTIGIALLAGVLGTLFFPPLGGLIAAPLAVLLLEAYRTRSLEKGWQALRGLAAGWGMSFLVRFGIGLVMMLLWWLWVWKG
ncbi:MAG TPA: DUF456 domain-containing protein [Anaerolineales bacterium]|nr:DUF456 domain-containing protein [Anaerolineales bacterium]